MFYQSVFSALLLLGLLGSLSAQTTIQGTVTDPAGVPLTGANLLLLPGDQGAASDADGQFSIPNVKAGDYTLRVSYVGYETLRRPLQIADGQGEISLQLTLEPRAFTAEELTVRATRAGPPWSPLLMLAQVWAIPVSASGAPTLPALMSP